jgi:hypothetical protein
VEDTVERAKNGEMAKLTTTVFSPPHGEWYYEEINIKPNNLLKYMALTLRLFNQWQK